MTKWSEASAAGGRASVGNGKAHVIVGVVLFMVISIGFILYIESKSYMGLSHCIKASTCVPTGDYIVNAKGCRIYDFAPFEFVHLSHFDSEPDVELPSCDPLNKGELVKATTTYLYVDTEYENNYTTTGYVNCCYQPFDRLVVPRSADDTYDNVEGEIRFSSLCHPFKEPAFIEHQFVYVKCENASKHQVYEDYFTFAVDRRDVDHISVGNSTSNQESLYGPPQEGGVRWTTNRPFNVLILGFDGMSRLNFLRQMPATASFFEEEDGTSLFGYNKVAYNTFPNLVPVLTGLNVTELRKTCWKSRNTSLDDCPFIWKLFDEKDYFTAYGEDNTFASTFTYRKAGFREQPVDYYLKPYYMLCESNLDVLALNPPTAIHCMGLRENLVRFVEVVKGFASNMKNKANFGVFWFNGMSHDFLNLGREADKTFRSMLESLKMEGVLNHTVVVALSDHGMRWGEFRATFQGFSEERLPLATILLPATFKTKFPQAVNNLKTNAKRLTSPFDLHETLLDVLSPTRLPDLNKDESKMTTLRSISLFQPVPEERTCKDAGIPPEFCACSDLKLVDDGVLSRRLGARAVQSLNQMISGWPSCAVLQLDKVESVFEQSSAAGNNNPFSIRNREFFIRFRTLPGNGSFEALMQIKKKVKSEIVEPLGVISRINMYHNDSYCVDDEILKLYCFCESQGSNDYQPETDDNSPAVNVITYLKTDAVDNRRQNLIQKNPTTDSESKTS